MTKQEFKNFEIIIGDGSLDNSVKDVVEKYKDKLNITYLYEKAIKASEARNWACENAKGEYLVFIDSDCIVPPQYFAEIEKFLQENNVDAFGGKDDALKDFTDTQKAINFAMTSFLTTGGIRGNEKSIDDFDLRGFNMGVKKDVFFKIGGFSKMEVAEDIDFSIRLKKAGYKAAYIPNAFVYHKRRDTLGKFRRQLFMHGKGRIDLYTRHKDSLKIIHFFPTVFTFYLITTVLAIFISPKLFVFMVLPVINYALFLFLDAMAKYHSVKTALLSVAAAFIMLTSYGTGLAVNFVNRIILKNNKDTEKQTILKH